MALVSILACLTLVPAVAQAGPSPEQTIAAIQAEAEAARAWIADRADEYDAFLATNPSAAAALTELNWAISEMNAKAAEAEVGITGKMAQHPADQEVQDAGNTALADVWDTAANEVAAIAAAYDDNIDRLPTAIPTVTTTVPTVTTTVPKVTTTVPTVTTTLLKATTTTTAPRPTTTVATSATTTAVAAGSDVPGTTTTTTVGEALPAIPRTEPPEPPISTFALAARLGSSTSMTRAVSTSAIGNPTTETDAPSRVGSVLELVRISLPSAIAEPIIDIVIILQAVAAAFLSGVLALVWPAAVLLLVVLVQAARRLGPSRPQVAVGAD